MLKNTAYRGDTETVEELYMNANQWSIHFHTSKLSEAKYFDTPMEATRYMNGHDIVGDHKIVPIEEKDLFEARLKNA